MKMEYASNCYIISINLVSLEIHDSKSIIILLTYDFDMFLHAKKCQKRGKMMIKIIDVCSLNQSIEY